MKNLSLVVVITVLAAAFVAVPAAPGSAHVSAEPSLWITDDTTKRTYHVELDGTPIASFPTPNTAISSVAVDPTDLSLWGANEGSASGTPPGKLVNYSRSGVVLGEVFASDFGGLNTEGAAVSVAVGNDTLWVVDDPASPAIESNVYNVARDGTLLSSFPVTAFDPNADSPQAIAYDPYSSSLWVTDNFTERVYNVSLNGQLLSSFPTNVAVFGTVLNVQGISVESADVLWMTARDTDRVYRITKAGDQVLSSFPMSTVDGAAMNPTGVAYDRPPGDLGSAAAFGVLGLPGSVLKMKDVGEFTGLVGDVGLGNGATQDFDSGLLNGTLLVDPDAQNTNKSDVVISGGTLSVDLDLAVADARFASLAASVLDPTQVFGEVKTDATIAGTPGLNVIELAKIDLDGETLTLVGDASSSFVVNVTTKLKLKNGSSIHLEGGLTANDVVFNIIGTDDSAIESGSYATGAILAPNAKLKIKGEGSMLLGAMIGGKEIKLEDGGRLRVFGEELAQGTIGVAAGSAVLALPDAKVKLADAASTVVGDVVLGPLAEQDFSKGLIDGALVVDPAADNTNANSVVISGGTITQPSSRAIADAVDASHAAARLTPDLTYGDIKSNTTIVGGPGLTVIAVNKVELDGQESLTLAGDPSTIFVINLADKLKLKNGSSIVLLGGVLPENVLFNVRGSGDSAIESGSNGQGTILAPWAGKLKVKDSGSTLLGSLIGGGDITIEKSGVLNQAS